MAEQEPDISRHELVQIARSFLAEAPPFVLPVNVIDAIRALNAVVKISPRRRIRFYDPDEVPGQVIFTDAAFSPVSGDDDPFVLDDTAVFRLAAVKVIPQPDGKSYPEI